jgi:hypothetical protein
LIGITKHTPRAEAKAILQAVTHFAKRQAAYCQLAVNTEAGRYSANVDNQKPDSNNDAAASLPVLHNVSPR